MKKFKVTFTVEGSFIGDDQKLNKSNVKNALRFTFDEMYGKSYMGNRDIDTAISKLEVKEIK